MTESSYEAAGVSRSAASRPWTSCTLAVEATHGARGPRNAGGFAGLYALAGYTEPVLASTIDGVGTKVIVAREMGTTTL